MRARTPAVGLRAGRQGRTFFQEDRHQCAVHFVAEILPFDELAARQRHRLISGDHLVEDGLKDLAETFTRLLPIRQRCHKLLHE
jgi:hypothetical protein